MRGRDPFRTMIRASLALEVLGFLVDAAFHGTVDGDFEPASAREMATHLLTVHALFFAGVAGLLVSTAGAFWRAMMRSYQVGEMGLAFAGALIQAAGQSWDAYEHMRLGHGPVVSWAMVVIGPALTVVGLWLSRRHRRRDAAARRTVDGAFRA